MTPVVFVPHMRTPLHLAGQRMLGILDLLAVLGAKLLSQLHSTGGADLHTLAAGNAIVSFYSCYICASGKIRRVKQLRSTQRVAHIDVAVTDCKDLVSTVNIGDLMDKAVFLTLAEDFQCLFLGDITAALAGLYHLVGHVANGNTPAFGVVGAAFVEGQTGFTAGTGGCGILALILIQPVGDMLHRNGLVFGFDGFFHGDNVHTDTGASGRHHGGHLLQRKAAHTLKEATHFRVLLQDGIVHIGKLSTAGNEHR